MEYVNQWIMAVTELVWVEYSFVTIGSNRASEVTHTNSTLKYLGLEGSEAEMKLKFLEDRAENSLDEEAVVESDSETTEEVSEEPKTEEVSEEVKVEEVEEDATTEVVEENSVEEPVAEEVAEDEVKEEAVVEEVVVEEVKEDNGNKDKKDKNAEAGELSVGDFVEWNSSGGMAFGEVLQIETEPGE